MRFRGITFIFLLVSFLTVYPLIWLIFGSFWSSAPGAPGHFTLDGYVRAYSSANFLPILSNTLFIVIMTVIISVSLAIVLAWIVTRTNTPGKKLLEQLIIIGFFLPPSSTVIAWILLASPNNGLLNLLLEKIIGIKPLNIFSLWGIIWHMVLSFASFCYMLIVDSFRQMDSTLEEAARTSGDKPLNIFFRVTLPLLSPAIIGAAILILLRGLETFESPAFLGLPAGITVFMTQIYDAITYHQPPEYNVAMALSITFLVITFVTVWAQWRYMKGKSFATVTGKNFRPTVTDLGKWKWLTFAFVGLYFLITVMLPLSQLVIASFQKVPGIYQSGMFTFDHYLTVFKDSEILRSFGNTLFLSILGSLICMLLSAFVAYIILRSNYRAKKLLDFISWLPWTIPGMVLALGILWGYIVWPGPINIYGTIWILLVSYITMGLPLGVRTMSSAFSQISNDLEESARVHGANWSVSFRTILLALIRPSIISGFFLLFILFSRELSASILLYSYGTEVISVSIFTYWSSGRSGVVIAISVLFILIVVVMLILKNLMLSLLNSYQKKKLAREKNVLGL